MSEDFYHWDGDTLELRVYLQPRASRDEIVGPHGEALKIRITAPPVEGKANTHLIRYLAGCFAVPRSQVVIEKGETSRNKTVRIHSPRKLPDRINAKK